MHAVTLIRYSQPTILDQAKYGTKCVVKNSNSDSYGLYVQTGKDQMNPQWELVGMFNSHTSQQYTDQLVDMRLGIKRFK